MKNKIRWAFGASLVLHFVLAGLLFLHSKSLMLDQLNKNNSLEVELIDINKLSESLKQKKHEAINTKGQVVQQDTNRVNDETPEDAKFLSRHNQKVVRESQAALNGKFNNNADTGSKSPNEKKAGKPAAAEPGEKLAEKNQTKGEKQEQFLTSEDGISRGKKPSLQDLTPSFKPGPPRIESQDIAQGQGQSPSATDDHLKNVPTGMQTLLSTREFVYYSYYNRIKDKLRQYWEPKIKEKMTRIIRQGRQIASSSDRITRIVIVLDHNGTLVRVQVVGPSGVEDLDEAAVEAFKAAAPFPNPPKGIVEDDGTIKIRWDFILEANAGGGLLEAVRLANAGK